MRAVVNGDFLVRVAIGRLGGFGAVCALVVVCARIGLSTNGKQ